MRNSLILAQLFLLLALFSTVHARAALVERLGGLAYYDTEANLTWLADANYAQTSGYDIDGRMNWIDANLWATSLDVAGITNWRLPNTIDVGNDGATYTNFYQGVDYGYNITTHSELSNMYYNMLNNVAVYDVNGIQNPCVVLARCSVNSGPFIQLKSAYYWSATEYLSGTNNAWGFYMSSGGQIEDDQSAIRYAWAVRDGDVAASIVPIPSAVWLFGSGLLGLIRLARRNGNV